MYEKHSEYLSVDLKEGNVIPCQYSVCENDSTNELYIPGKYSQITLCISQDFLSISSSLCSYWLHTRLAGLPLLMMLQIFSVLPYVASKPTSL